MNPIEPYEQNIWGRINIGVRMILDAIVYSVTGRWPDLAYNYCRGLIEDDEQE